MVSETRPQAALALCVNGGAMAVLIPKVTDQGLLVSLLDLRLTTARSPDLLWAQTCQPKLLACMVPPLQGQGGTVGGEWEPLCCGVRHDL